MSSPVDGPPAAEWMRGRTVLVTGGGGRDDGGPGTIGWAICRLLARHGAAIAVLDRDPAASARTVAQIRGHGATAVAITADVTDDAECARAVSEAVGALGSLDTLVNNVARWSAGSVFDFDATQFDEMIALNLKAAWSMIRHAAPAMGSAAGATPAIVNVSSVAATRPGTMYGLGKAATEALTRGATQLLADREIRINAVQLGALWSGAVAANFDAAAREARREMVALRTEGTCWDAADAVLFLASERARWISGQVLTVDGGGFGRMPYPGVSRERTGDSEPVSAGARG